MMIVKPGVYKHYKGGTYTVIAEAVDGEGETHEVMVIYMAHAYPERLVVRPARVWDELILWKDGVYRPRFTPIYEVDSYR